MNAPTLLLASFLIASCAGASTVAPVSLGDLYCEADLVALVETVGGTTRGYSSPVFSARVVEAFKGTAEGAVVHFGPYATYRVGSEYLVFLKGTGKTLASIKNSPSPLCLPDEAAYYSAMYSGNSIMDVEYSLQVHEYGVKVSFPWLQVGSELAGVPLKSAEEPGLVWFQKGSFLSLLRSSRCERRDTKK